MGISTFSDGTSLALVLFLEWLKSGIFEAKNRTGTKQQIGFNNSRKQDLRIVYTNGSEVQILYCPPFWGKCIA
jgi:hypothetical protein